MEMFLYRIFFATYRVFSAIGVAIFAIWMVVELYNKVFVSGSVGYTDFASYMESVDRNAAWSEKLNDIRTFFVSSLAGAAILAFLFRNLAGHFSLNARRKRFEKAVSQVKHQAAKTRENLSDEYGFRNIQPLVDSVRKELTFRRKYVSPIVWESVLKRISDFEHSLDVDSVSKLYEVITQSDESELNERLRDL